jgi:hypothetical protein
MTEQQNPVVAASRLRALSSLMNILNDFNIRHGDQSLGNHLIQGRDQALNILFGVDNLDQDRRVGGKMQQVRAANYRAGSIAFNPW